MFEDDPQYLENPPTRFFPGFLTGFIVAALIAVFLFFSLGDSGSALLARWRTGNATSTASQPAPPEPASAPVAPAETSAAPAPQLPATVGSEDAPEAPLPPIQPPLVTQPAPAAERPQAPTSSSAATADAGDAELARAQSYLNQRSGGQASRAAAVPLLWSAVEKGNLTALITLGDLYARGDGVPKNCNQARVLLRAAAEKGSREASQQLAQVVRSCR